MTERCRKCQKDRFLCICDMIKPVQTGLHVLILQHPQEPDKELGSARIVNLALENSTLKVGLSWPNLKKALGREGIQGNWAVLYLGGRSHHSQPKQRSSAHLSATDKLGKIYNPSDLALEGIVVLDGTWAQAKAIWWRNPWLLKLKRLILTPSRPSLYGRLRKEPRRECLSTIEAVADTLEAFGEKEVSATLREYFAELLRRYHAPNLVS